MDHDSMIAVIQAHKEGKPLQWRNRGNEQNKWNDANPPTFSFGELDYRVKPEPREWWLIPAAPPWAHWRAYDQDQREPNQVHVREVIE